MKEIWKEIDWIPDLRGEYEVSNLGNIRRTALIWHDSKTGEEKLIYKTRDLKPYDNGHGYLYITFPIDTRIGRKQKTLYIHRLVAEAFLKNPDNKPEVNHKNYIRRYNRVSNLEWCTAEENIEHSKTMDSRLKPYYPSHGCKYRDDEFEKRKDKNEKSANTYSANKNISEYNINRPKAYHSSKKPFEERNIYFENGKYTVRIGYKRKTIYIGRFLKFEDAVKARAEKLKELNLLN